MSTRPVCTICPPAKYIEDASDLVPSHSAHHQAVPPSSAEPVRGSSTLTLTSTPTNSDVGLSPSPDPPISTTKRPRARLITIDDDTNTTNVQDLAPKLKRLKPTPTQAAAPVPQNEPSIIEINNNNDLKNERLNKSNATADIKEFFVPIPREPGQEKGQGLGCAKQEKILTGEHSTLRHHAAALHLRRYRKWCKLNNFDSMLPDDAKKRKIVEKQPSVTEHFGPDERVARPTPYSEKALETASIEWLIQTNQPIAAFKYPAFKKMLEIASQANRGIRLPSPKQSRSRIITMFKQQLYSLKERLNGPSVGEVSLTCDAWQASNTDAYFAITGHWIKEHQPGVWSLEQALIGFVQMNMVHNGARLGQALYKVCNRLQIVPKISHVTCDNAKNNDTMLEEFARCYFLKTGSTFDVKRCHIRCLAHIINLAMQAVITTCSKAKYYNSTNQDDNKLPEDLGATKRDEIGIVRAICIKARSSAQCKEVFRAIQYQRSVLPVQLLLDMKVRWSSTFVMLSRAKSRREAVDEFVLELGLKENSSEKRHKITALALNVEEWMRVCLFCNILQHANDAQQAFSSASTPSLHNALLALERLHAVWEKASGKSRYLPFVQALNAGMAKLNQYYERSAELDAHILAMVLNPKKKMAHFTKHWPPELFEEVESVVRERFVERYKVRNANEQGQVKHACRVAAPSSKLGHRNVDDTDSSSDDEDYLQASSTVNYLEEWNLYLNTNEIMPDDIGIVGWWGLYGSHYPTWQSLARDYLSIMASSVSSEWAFSSAGITICKRRNRLDADIVEALQCLKSLLHQDLMVRDVITIADGELELDSADLQPVNQDNTTIEVVGASDETDDLGWGAGDNADADNTEIEIV